jgi:hypothetical protein
VNTIKEKKIMSTLFIQKRVSKYQNIVFFIMERINVEYNGVKGFENQETGYEFQSFEAAQSKLQLMLKLRK